MSTPAWFYRDIFPGDMGLDVLAAQRLLGALKTGVMDEDTVARVRGLQRATVSQITGVVDHATAVQLGNRATFGLIPAWFEAEDWTVLPDLLRCGAADVEPAVRRFQSHHHIRPTGVVDEATAIALGE